MRKRTAIERRIAAPFLRRQSLRGNFVEGRKDNEDI